MTRGTRVTSALQTLVSFELATRLSGTAKWESPPKDKSTFLVGNVPDSAWYPPYQLRDEFLLRCAFSRKTLGTTFLKPCPVLWTHCPGVMFAQHPPHTGPGIWLEHSWKLAPPLLGLSVVCLSSVSRKVECSFYFFPLKYTHKHTYVYVCMHDGGACL